MAKRRWPFVVLGIAIVLIFVGIGAVIATVAWFQENVDITTSTPGDAEAEFETVRRKFPGREPLLELHNGVPRYTKARETSAATSTSLHSLKILVWDPDEERILRFSLPFWFVRLKSDPIRFGSYASGFDDEESGRAPRTLKSTAPASSSMPRRGQASAFSSGRSSL
jgi:hypothetical protein